MTSKNSQINFGYLALNDTPPLPIRLWHRLRRWNLVRSSLGEQIPPFGVFGLIDLAAGEPLVQGAQRSWTQGDA